MKKKLIRLTESDLHRIIKESVRRIIMEEASPEEVGKQFIDFIEKYHGGVLNSKMNIQTTLNFLDKKKLYIYNVETIDKNVGCSTPELKLVENPTVDDPNSNVMLKSSGSLKQEVDNEQLSLFKF